MSGVPIAEAFATETVTVSSQIHETWDYADAVARNAVWPVTQSNATGSASGGFGGADLSMTIGYGGGIGGGSGFVKFTRTITGTPGGSLTVTCDTMTLSRAASAFNDNCGLSVNGATGHVPTSGLSGPVSVSGTFDVDGNATIVLGHFDLEFGMTPITITVGSLQWTGSESTHQVNHLADLFGPAYLFEGDTFLGVTQNGLRFDPKVEKRNIPFDNKWADISEADWDTFSGALITGQFVQLVSRFNRFESGATASTPGGNVATRWSPHEAGAMYVPGNYLTNLRIIWPSLVSGFVQVRFPSALCLFYHIDGETGTEAKVSATFAARRPLASMAAGGEAVKPYIIELLDAAS